MSRALLVLVLAFVAAGCSPAEGRPRATFQARARTSTTVGLMRVHFADELGQRDRLLAEEAIRAHAASIHRLHFAVVFHLGQSWPTRTLDVYVHPGVTLGSRYMADVPGYLAPDGSVHVVVGSGAVVPELIRLAAHAWWHPNPDESLFPAFWVEVKREQDVSVKRLMAARVTP